MRSLQELTSICSRLQSGGLAESASGATALTVCAKYMWSGIVDRGFWSSTAQRFIPTTAEPRRADGGTSHEIFRSVCAN